MKRKPILITNIEKKRSLPRQTIGILGSHPGAGVTHIGMLLSFYLGERMGLKTAFLECNNHNHMDLIETAYHWRKIDELSFSFHNITCYKNVNKQRILEISSGDYESIIMDFGTDWRGNQEEFLRSGTKIVVGGQAPWCKERLVDFIHSVQDLWGNDRWNFLVPYAHPQLIRSLRKEVSKKVYSVPFEQDPTYVSKETSLLFNKILF
ncbi:MAG TPA: hypothetical protein GXZ28_01230 [Clostridiales bacterium]|jgi:hypothetical protein|nr:hypothetical protein [Clostridiales bacterium]